MLFLHGAGGWPATLPFFTRLSRHYALLVPEHPGFGASDDPKWLRSVADLAMYYLDLLDHTFSSPVHVVGHSLGGWTAAEAGRAQHRSHRQPHAAGAGRHPRQRHSARRQLHLVTRGRRPQSLSRPKLCRGAAQGAAPERGRARYRAANEAGGGQIRLGAAAGSTPTWRSGCIASRVPTHVVWGARTKSSPAAYAQLWGERVPGAPVSMVEACGHSPHVEQSRARRRQSHRLSRSRARMKFVCFHLMPYRPLDLEAATGTARPGWCCPTASTIRRKAPPIRFLSRPARLCRAARLRRASASTSIIRPPTA